ncbi:MAG: hypothetical protein ACTSQA_00095 [Candidatus Heimdallarchaeaceae archaeon]
MENSINLEELKKLTIGEILVLESQQKGIHGVIEGMKERVSYMDEQIKTGNFAEDLVNGI